LHGGCSTGPKTPEGRERCRQARLKHGKYSAATMRHKAAERSFLREARELLNSIDGPG